MPKLHNDLHFMPVVIWWKIGKEDDATDLIIAEKIHPFPFSFILSIVGFVIDLFIDKKDIIKSYCNDQRSRLNDDFTDFFGVQKKHKKRLDLIGKRQYYIVKFAITKNNHWITKRERIEIELDGMKPMEAKDKNDYEELRSVSMSLEGANMDPKSMSVIQYYSDLDLAIRRSKQIKLDAKRTRK